MSDLKQGMIRVKLDYAPAENGKEFDEWCKKHDFDPLNSGRRAWCSSLSTYFRDALGVAYNSGESFLFYAEDLAEPVNDQLVAKHFVNATPDDEYPIRILQAHRDDCDLEYVTDGSKTSDTIAKIMNENNAKRAVILDKALAKLRAK